MIRLALTLIACLLVQTLSAQQGDLYLTHHDLNVEGLDNRNYEIAASSKGQLCIANRSGVLLYDGSKWEYISTPSAALSITYDTNDNIYVGCVGDYGKIDYIENKFQFVSLNPHKHDKSLYFKTVHIDSSIYFLSEDNLLRHNIYQNKSNLLFLDNPKEYFTNLFYVDNTILVQTNDDLYKYAGDSLSGRKIQVPEGARLIFFNKSPVSDKYVVGTTNNKTYIYHEKKFYECKISDFLTQHNSFVNNGVWLNDRYFALSTLEDGCILYDNKHSKIVEVINQSKGLPDNHIYTLGVDAEEGLWISHEFGLTRMEINIPFRSFSNFPGLEGNLSEALFYEHQLYVATSEGVFYLDKENLYASTVYYVEKNAKKTSEPEPELIVEEPKKSRWRIFGKKTDAEKKVTKSAATKTSKNFERRVKKELISSKYIFKPVKGIHGKTKTFIVYNNKLFVAGTSGVYEIKKEKDKTDDEKTTISAEQVIHTPVKFITIETKTNRLIIGNHYNEIKLYHLEGDIWNETGDLNLHGDLVMSVFSDQSNRTWFVTPSALLEFHEFSAENLKYNKYEYKNQFIDDVRLSYIGKQLYLINSEGYFYLNTDMKKMVEDTVLLNKIGKPVKHLQQKDGIVWVFNGENWYKIDKDKNAEKKNVFNMFPEMTFVSEFGNTQWLINDSREILQFVPAISDSLVSNNKMFISRITNNLGDVELKEKMFFEHDESTFHFELSRPDYRGLTKIEYQYILSGLQNEWSAWREISGIDFPKLMPGKYELMIKSRDTFGAIQESPNVTIVINPPYWQTLWFYGLQILIMASLVITSMQMNRRAKVKYVIITEGLTILTIVLVIEFLQTVAASYLSIQSSPVIDFGIDAGIALCVFPLEQMLKKYMKAEKKGPSLNGKGLTDMLKPETN